MLSCSVVVELDDGVSARFWSDSWLPAEPTASFAPHLFLAIGRRFLKVFVKEALSGRRWVRHITGAHIVPVLCEYIDFWAKLEVLHLQLLVSDRFIWRWMPDGTYSASSAYRSFFLGMSSL
jgi:hypothetical protein